ncbi:MAG: cation:proton antiporter [Prevotella sp.]|nr:cation:proton antiporter [Prevotella sp.]
MSLIQDLALILVVAGIVTLLFRKLRQPLVLGYIVAGFLVSPHMPYIMSVVERRNIQTWADIGVMFLLFSLGLDFSFKKIMKMGASPMISACSIIFCMTVLGICVAHAFGWSRMDCIFLGGMLAMSSTTIIFKAFDDMSLRQHHFASVVISVLILEDILAIVMMVMLAAIAGGSNPDGGEMAQSILRIVFFLVLWFVVGIFAIPLFLRHIRKLMSNETLLIVSLGLCCLMAVISAKAGFSSAFGAFVMGSILAETVEADKIGRIVEPVKNLFGAIFFVSVGMLVDPSILISYYIPILSIVLTIIIGQSVFGSFSFLLGGESLRNAIRCGFSMAQIGEFAFIIASLGLSLGVISDFLYPVVVAVSVITTFLTPYMMKASVPCYGYLERHLPKRLQRSITLMSGRDPQHSDSDKGNWHKLLRAMVINTMIYSILSIAVIAISITMLLPFLRSVIPSSTNSSMPSTWIANLLCGIVTIIAISPFLRAIVMKKNHSEEFQALWSENRINRFPLVFTIICRTIIAMAFVFYVCNYLTHFTNAILITVAVIAIVLMVMSRKLKRHSIRLERLFVMNLRSRDIAAQARGKRRPLYEGRLLDRDIHIAEIEIPENSRWAGKRLSQLRLRNRFGVHVSSILRGIRRINTPSGDCIIFPGDKIQAIGSDSQLAKFSTAADIEIYQEDTEIERKEMQLKQLLVTSESMFIGKTLSESKIRDEYHCMVVGLDTGKKNLTMISPTYRFEDGDIIWIVGEADALKRILNTYQ